MKIYKVISVLLAILLLFTGVISVISGIVMIATNGMGMPLAFLEGTAFTSYLIPGLILLIIIAGVTLLAGILLVKKKKGALEAAAASGFGLLIWLFTEALVILIAVMILLKLTAKILK